MARKLTNADLLLQDGLVSYFDPIDGVTKQITVEAARRIAKVNSDMKKQLKELGVKEEEEVGEEKTEEEDE